MIYLNTAVTTVMETVKELTDLVGLVEKNLASYDRIEARFRRKRISRRLQEILGRLTSWRMMNMPTLWMIGKMAINGELRPGVVVIPMDNSPYDNNYKYDLLSFMDAILSTRDLIEEFKKDLLWVDYKLYEELQDAVDGRINILRMLSDTKEDSISIDKLKIAYASYSTLVESIEKLKGELQIATRNVSAQRPASLPPTDKKRRLPKNQVK
jgi:hypothetical protein